MFLLCLPELSGQATFRNIGQVICRVVGDGLWIHLDTVSDRCYLLWGILVVLVFRQAACAPEELHEVLKLNDAGLVHVHVPEDFHDFVHLAVFLEKPLQAVHAVLVPHIVTIRAEQNRPKFAILLQKAKPLMHGDATTFICINLIKPPSQGRLVPSSRPCIGGRVLLLMSFLDVTGVMHR